MIIQIMTKNGNLDIELISDVPNGLLVCLDKSFYDKKTADHIFEELQKNVVYDANSTVKIFGKIYPIPRKQTAYGDPGTTYSFAGCTVEPKQWTSGN